MSVYTLHHGDCLDVLRAMPDASVHSIVTDPPYGLSFMGKRWDYDVPSVDVWAECLRVLKPGGHLLAFAGTRTQHRMAVRIEDAGFEIRDMIAWVYGSGFPKSLDVSKAIDKAAGAERQVVGSKLGQPGYSLAKGNPSTVDFGPQSGDPEMECAITAPATDAARQWQGWGTALKPALEPITMARKPLAGTVAENVLAHGTGALNIDGGRVPGEPVPVFYTVGGRKFGQTHTQPERRTQQVGTSDVGRWPANLIHDGSEHVLAWFPVTKSGSLNAGHKQGAGSFGKIGGETILRDYGGDTGSAARFFYCAKASKADRGASNTHPTVKPTDLMRYLCRLVTPAGGTVLDPFMGSGSTGKAAILEGFGFVGIEREADYIAIAEARIRAVCTMYDEGRAA